MDQKTLKAIILVFLFLLSTFSGIILAGQILGMVGLYYPILVFVLTVLLSGGLFLLSLKTCNNFLIGIKPDAHEVKLLSRASMLGYVLGGVILLLVLVLPLALWPQTGINNELTWDAGLYHFPKAAELIVSHSLLDLSIAYGDYPSGYETVIAFSLLLNRDGFLIGAVHALILIFFQIGFFLLLIRFSKIPKGVLFFIAVFTLASFDIIRSIESNPFQLLRITAFTIGKNDFFLSAAVIAMLVFSPIGPNSKNFERYSLEGLGLSAFLIIATKPNGILVALGLWGLVLFYEIRDYIKNRVKFKNIFFRWLIPVILSYAGLLWAVRNLVIKGFLFSPDSLAIQKYSIISNLSNPNLYNHLDLNFKIILVLILCSIIYTVFWKRFHWSILFTDLILLLGFAVTPASAFFGYVDQPAEIAWRFGMPLLAFQLPVFLLMIDQPILAIFKKMDIPTCSLNYFGDGFNYILWIICKFEQVKIKSEEYGRFERSIY